MVNIRSHGLRRVLLSAFAVWLCASGSAFAQTWPSRPVTLVVPFPPGGGPDFFARVLGEKLSPKLGQPLLVDNRPGVGGLAGASFVAKAAPDGHTFLVAPNTIAIAPHLLPKGAGGGVDVMKDLVPVVMPSSTPIRRSIRSSPRSEPSSKARPGRSRKVVRSCTTRRNSSESGGRQMSSCSSS